MMTHAVSYRTIFAAIVLAVISERSVGQEPTMTIDCACRTKKNPSWCETKIGDFEIITWTEKAFRKPGEPLDADALALFCQRHFDLQCQCKDDKKYFSGSIEN